MEKTIRALKRNRISADVLKSREEVITYLENLIEDAAVVGVGDSMTLDTLGVYDYLRGRNLAYLNKYDPSLSKQEKRELYLKNFTADYFLSGVNAISTEGKIYNMDGNGSRVAPIIYGPKCVLLICGINKIVESEEEAIRRIREVAAPLDAKRLNKKTPCAMKGKCMDCKSPQKICNYFTVIQGQFDEARIRVLFVEEELGY
ncbi:MAG: lactate utilization protein [Bacteroides sp.]|nr:lactate utilization protein [Bacteroides sp.]